MLDHLGLEVTDYERSKGFYERALAPLGIRGDGAGANGSGLGLALVRQQAQLHGGEVAVSDSPLGGARFSVHFVREAADGS